MVTLGAAAAALGAAQEYQVRGLKLPSVSYKDYYIGPLRWQISCVMPEECQSQCCRKQITVTKVVHHAPIERCQLSLRHPGFFHCLRHRNSLRSGISFQLEMWIIHTRLESLIWWWCVWWSALWGKALRWEPWVTSVPHAWVCCDNVILGGVGPLKKALRAKQDRK